MEIKGCIAVVTGAASGIGAAVEAALRERGAMTAGVDLKWPDNWMPANCWSADVTKPGEMACVMREVSKMIGQPTILVPCAGVGPFGFLFDGTWSEYDCNRIMAVNFDHPRRWLQRFVVLQNGEPWCCVLPSSIHDSSDEPGLAIYGASKAALTRLGLTADKEAKRKNGRVRVARIPYTETPMTRGIEAEKRARLEAKYGAFISPHRVATAICDAIEDDGPTVFTIGAVE